MTIEEAVERREQAAKQASKISALAHRFFIRAVNDARKQGIPMSVIARRAGMSRQNLYRLMKGT